MSKFPIVVNEFSGGLATSLKQGTPNSFAFSLHLDFRKDPMSLTPLPATTLESGLVVTDLITDMIQLPSGLEVAIGNAGHVYKRTTGGVWSDSGTILPDTAAGMVYNLQQDTVYIPGLTSMHTITNADGRFSGSFTVNANVFVNQTDQSSSAGHTNSYTVPTTTSESTADKLTITPTIEPLYSIKVWVTAAGATGNITITMHDQANNVLGTKVIAANTLIAGSYNEFVFATPIRMYAKPNPSAYHFHISASAGTTTIGTSTTNDFSTADYQSRSNRFVNPTNGVHPVIEFLQYYLIGNGRYVTQWEPISQTNPSALEFNQHRLTLPSGYEVTSMAVYANLYVAIGAEKRSSSATNEFQDGKIFLWDGTAPTYNDVIDIPEGSPFSLFSHKKVLYYYAGGSWWAYAGGQPVKIFQIPGTDFEGSGLSNYVVINPHMMTVRNGILLIGVPTDTNSQTLDHAVYSFGQRNKNYPNSFGRSYSISTLRRFYDGSNALQIGTVKSFGDKTFVSWRDDSQNVGARYGVDTVSPTSSPYATFSWESLINDFRFISIKRRFARPDTDKQATYLTITFSTLPAGCTITPKYKINRQSDWVLGAPAVVGSSSIMMNINKRYKEIQFGFDGTATVNFPVVTAVVLITDALGSEED